MTELFASLRPFKNRIEDFFPNDTMPWTHIAENYLKCITPTGFISTRSFAEIEEWVTWVSQNINLSPLSSILDVGCGPGSYSNRLAKLGYRVLGIDISDVLLEYARNQAKKEGLFVDYTNLSINNIEYSSLFDLILIFQSIFGSLTTDQVKNILSSLNRALKPGGSILLEIELFSKKLHNNNYIKEYNLRAAMFSPWSNKFHVWLERLLLFTKERQKIMHHLIHCADEEPKEYWFKSFLYDFHEINELIKSNGMYIYKVLNPTSGKPCDPEDGPVILWIKK